MEQVQNDFENNGYIVLRNVIDKNLLEYMANQIKLTEKILCFEKNVKPTEYAFCDSQTRTSFAYYSSLTTETLLEVLQDKIEKTVNKKLFPTYSYLRIYYQNSILNKHTDRPSCEYSATICITLDKEPWDIWFETKNQENVKVALEPGDLIIYKGMELPHWRDLYENKEQIQVFLHYVDQNGEHSEYKYDKRPMLATCKR
jgi:hypothetical protein